MSIHDRKFKKRIEQERLEQLISDASTLETPVRFVELMQVRRNSIGLKYQGLDELKVRESTRNGGQEFSMTPIWVADGQLKFHPDIRKISWGYLPITEKNLNFLATSLRRNDFRIMDEEILKKVTDIAIEKGWPTSIHKSSQIDILMSRDKAKKDEELIKDKELRDENAILKAELLAMRESKIRAEIEEQVREELSKKVNKPLGNTKISKAKRESIEKEKAEV
jgi:hypothetical protein